MKNLHAEFDQEEKEQAEQEHIATEKDKQKAVDTVQHTCHIAEDVLNRLFMGRLSSYKKDDLRALAIALSLNNKNTNNALILS